MYYMKPHCVLTNLCSSALRLTMHKVGGGGDKVLCTLHCYLVAVGCQGWGDGGGVETHSLGFLLIQESIGGLPSICLPCDEYFDGSDEDELPTYSLPQ